MAGISTSLRLKHEKQFLEKYFYGEKFLMKKIENGQTIFEREVKTENGNIYRLRIYVGPNYPHQLPDLVVCGSPKPMPKWEGGHVTHTYPSIDGLLRICFFRPARWSRENKLYQVFNKGEEWLEAYEEHLLTGKNICEILDEMLPSEEEIKQERRCIEQGLIAMQDMFMQAFLANFMISQDQSGDDSA